MKKDIFIKEYSEKLKCEKASLFIGSGISRKSGYANWKDILRECAEEINLDVDKESDLITLAEFYVKGKQRTKIDQTIASYFKDKKKSYSTSTEEDRKENVDVASLKKDVSELKDQMSEMLDIIKSLSNGEVIISSATEEVSDVGEEIPNIGSDEPTEEDKEMASSMISAFMTGNVQEF